MLEEMAITALDGAKKRLEVMRNTKSRYELQNTKYSWGRVQGEKEMEGTGKDEEEGPCDTGALWTVQLNQWNIFPQTIQLKFKTSCL